jgi:hypothetical protein
MTRSSEELAGEAGEWECMECGYLEKGFEGRRPKKCPECEAPASALEFFSDQEDGFLGRAVGDEDEEEEFDENDEDDYKEEDRGSFYR